MSTVTGGSCCFCSHDLYCRPKKYENPKFKEQEEKLRLAFTEQVKKEENRFRQWEAQVYI